jgi:hypothetical protein
MVFASATRAFSPPLSTFIFLSTSSPPKRKQPKRVRSSSSVFCAPNSFHFFQYGIIQVQGFHLVLGIKGFVDVMAPPAFAGDGFRSGNNAQQGRFSFSVCAYQRNLVAAFNFADAFSTMVSLGTVL